MDEEKPQYKCIALNHSSVLSDMQMASTKFKFQRNDFAFRLYELEHFSKSDMKKLFHIKEDRDFDEVYSNWLATRKK